MDSADCFEGDWHKDKDEGLEDPSLDVLVTEEGGDRSSQWEDRWAYQILHICQTLGTISEP